MSDRKRRRLDVQGRVQGVGFRPTIYALATELNLTGCVGNDSSGAFIEVEGPSAVVDHFEQRLPDDLPVRGHVTRITTADLPLAEDAAFVIRESETHDTQRAEISPEIAVCSDCVNEMLDPTNRRYQYPFINCTNCGPRYSIVQNIPYDRQYTTMDSFTMCPACQAEYDTPTNRRFHAQPNACPVCGPRASLVTNEGTPINGYWLDEVTSRLLSGDIVAIKGLGGFHLACRADQDETVQRLRDRKGRDAKPFAIMVESAGEAWGLADFSAQGLAQLSDWRSPIVLAPKQPTSGISDRVAPRCGSLGVMLPYTPLHVLIMSACKTPLVMTSANPSDEPLCSGNEEALERLAHIADCFLLHNRDIERRVDDSIILSLDNGAMPIRRSRGFTPEPIMLDSPLPKPILALGGDLKSVICIGNDNQAVMSEHLGDLANPAAFRNFISAIERFKTILNVEPELCVCDQHPGYHSVRHAGSLDIPVVQVQHHHAHLESCKLEHQLTGPTLGLAADGTGYGTDGAIWGCELMMANGATFDRLGHLRYFPLPGGDNAAKETWRPALSLLHATFAESWRDHAPIFLESMPDPVIRMTEKQVSASSTPKCSSLGRLFDGVACLTGLCSDNTFEAQAAMALEAAAQSFGTAPPLAYAIDGTASFTWDWRPMIRELVELRAQGIGAAELAARFHATLVAMFAEAIKTTCNTLKKDHVVLSGGCFFNRILTQDLMSQLIADGITPYVQEEVPAGDGGLALGQMAIARETISTYR